MAGSNTTLSVRRIEAGSTGSANRSTTRENACPGGGLRDGQVRDPGRNSPLQSVFPSVDCDASLAGSLAPRASGLICNSEVTKSTNLVMKKASTPNFQVPAPKRAIWELGPGSWDSPAQSAGRRGCTRKAEPHARRSEAQLR